MISLTISISKNMYDHPVYERYTGCQMPCSYRHYHKTKVENIFCKNKIYVLLCLAGKYVNRPYWSVWNNHLLL